MGYAGWCFRSQSTISHVWLAQHMRNKKKSFGVSLLSAKYAKTKLLLNWCYVSLLMPFHDRNLHSLRYLEPRRPACRSPIRCLRLRWQRLALGSFAVGIGQTIYSKVGFRALYVIFCARLRVHSMEEQLILWRLTNRLIGIRTKQLGPRVAKFWPTSVLGMLSVHLSSSCLSEFKSSVNTFIFAVLWSMLLFCSPSRSEL